jgi:hypothetical protein
MGVVKFTQIPDLSLYHSPARTSGGFQAVWFGGRGKDRLCPYPYLRPALGLGYASILKLVFKRPRGPGSTQKCGKTA